MGWAVELELVDDTRTVDEETAELDWMRVEVDLPEVGCAVDEVGVTVGGLAIIHAQCRTERET